MTLFRLIGELLRIAVCAVLVTALCLSAAVKTEARPKKGSEQLALAREIPTDRYSLLDEGRLPALYWAAYVYREPGGSAGAVPCAYIGAIQYIGPRLGFFKFAGECGEAWPEAGVRKPAFSLIRQRTYAGERKRDEALGLMLLSRPVRRIKVYFGSGTSVWAAARSLSTRHRAESLLPALRYATFVIRQDRCVSRVKAYGVGNERIGEASYPNC